MNSPAAVLRRTARKLAVKTIALSQMYETVVDDDDYEVVSQYNWWVHLKKGVPNSTPYVRGSVNGKKVLLHRFIMGAGAGQQVDHKDRNGLNNLRSNLRIANVSQNKANEKKRVDNTTQFKGVSFRANRASPKKFRATISVGGKKKELGYFLTAEEAFEAYKAAAISTFGEFARF